MKAHGGNKSSNSRKEIFGVLKAQTRGQERMVPRNRTMEASGVPGVVVETVKAVEVDGVDSGASLAVTSSETKHDCLNSTL